MSDDLLAFAPLPPDVPDEGRAAGTVFDSVARIYDAARPSYPNEAIAMVGDRCRLDRSRTVLEIGCGTGQVTRALAAFGSAVRALEPGAHLAEVARENLAGLPRVEVTVSSFEAADEPAGAYDAVISGTAFHWVDPSISYAKSARVLRRGGQLVLLTNAPASGGTDDAILPALSALHARAVPGIPPWAHPSVESIAERARAGGDIAAVWGRVERSLGRAPEVDALFSPPEIGTFAWRAEHDRRSYLDLLRTQSSYAMLPLHSWQRFHTALGRLIDEELGGRVTKQYVCVVAISEAVSRVS